MEEEIPIAGFSNTTVDHEATSRVVQSLCIYRAGTAKEADMVAFANDDERESWKLRLCFFVSIWVSLPRQTGLVL